MTIAIPSLRAITCTPQWVRNDLWRRARAVPSLDLQFADRKSLVDAVTGSNLVTFTRASDATYIGSDGLLKTATTNEPRFDHNPLTGECLGLLVEEQRTNSIRNNTMQGAVAGTPGTLPTNWSVAGTAGGITSSVIGTGVENGINYVDLRINGTSTSSGAYFINFDLATATAASSGQAWTCSAYIGVVSGSFTGIGGASTRVIERAAGGSYVGETTTSFLGITNTQVSPSARIVATRGSMGATTQFVSGALGLQISSAGAAIDITLRIGLPQLEQGSFATSVIPTSGTAATRNADVASITGANFTKWFLSSNLNTFYVQAIKSQANPINGCFFSGSNVSLNAVAGGNISFDGNGTRVRIQSRHGAVRGDTGSTAALVTPGTLIKACLCTSEDSFGAAFNGTILTSTGSPLQGNWDNALAIGHFPNGGYLSAVNGTISRLTYWPARLSNSTLQSLTQ